MHTRITFTIDKEAVTFHLHELVKIAIDLIPRLPREKIFVPKEGDFDRFIAKQTQGKEDYAFITGELDQYLIMPMTIRPPYKIEHFLYLADELTARYQRSKLQAWWLPIGDRLLKIKNSAEYGFYISDHGFYYDIFDRCRKVAILSPWIDGNYASQLEHVLHQFNTQDKLTQAKYINDMGALYAQAPIEKFREEFPSRTPHQLQKLKDTLTYDANSRQLHVERFFSEIRYMNEVLRPTLSELQRKNPEFFTTTYQTYGDKLHISYAVIQRLTLFEIIKKINMGTHELMYRPVFSYGDQETGNSYHEFEKTIREYFKRKNPISESSLAKTMRSILKGQAIDDDSLAFLPNLIAAWFVAEPARNPVSLLSGLMLLDLIENQIIYRDEHRSNLYSLINTLIHPLKSTAETKANDSYKKSCKLDKIGGSHPMAHTGSKNESLVQLANLKELNLVRQKEGRIFLHWLVEYSKSHYPNLKISLETEEKLPTPNYDSLSLENNPRLIQIKNSIKKIIKDLKQSNTPNSEKNIQRKKTLEELSKEQDQIIMNGRLKERVKIEYIEKAFRHRLGNFENILENKEAKENVLDASTLPNQTPPVPSSNPLTPLVSMMLKNIFPQFSLFFTEEKTEEILKLSEKEKNKANKTPRDKERFKRNTLFSFFEENEAKSIKPTAAEIEANQLLIDLRGDIPRKSLLI